MSTKRYRDRMHRIARKTHTNEEEFQESRKCIQCKHDLSIRTTGEPLSLWSVFEFAEYMEDGRERDKDVTNYCRECLLEHWVEAHPPRKDSRGIDI